MSAQRDWFFHEMMRAVGLVKGSWFDEQAIVTPV